MVKTLEVIFHSCNFGPRPVRRRQNLRHRDVLPGISSHVVGGRRCGLLFKEIKYFSRFGDMLRGCTSKITSGFLNTQQWRLRLYFICLSPLAPIPSVLVDFSREFYRRILLPGAANTFLELLQCLSSPGLISKRIFPEEIA